MESYEWKDVKGKVEKKEKKQIWEVGKRAANRICLEGNTRKFGGQKEDGGGGKHMNKRK